METEWEQFKRIAKPHVLAFKRLYGEKANAKQLVLDFFDTNAELSNDDIVATLPTIYSSDNKREATVVAMLAFLWAYESSYVSCLDACCYMLTVTGHDLFNLENRKYVRTLEEIGNVSTYTKIEFLKEHGFTIFERTKDRQLRNKIAHHDFTIDSDGKVLINKETIDIIERFEELICFAPKVYVTLAECFEEL